MNCTHVKNKLLDYMDDALYPDERQEMTLHLEQCPACNEQYHASKAFSDNFAEFIVYPDAPYAFQTLRARMAAIRPLEEVIAFLPRMHAQSTVCRVALAVVLLLFVMILPGALRFSRDAYEVSKRPFQDREEVLEEYYADLHMDEEKSKKAPDPEGDVRG